MKDNFKVDFIGVGAPRCGTTWLARCLAEHPEVDFADEKETNFFNKDYNFKKGPSFYKRYFSKDKDYQVKARGEFSPFYYLNPKSAYRIKSVFPEAKILICLRNPVDRAFSQYMYRKKNGRESNKNFLTALAENEDYLESGYYYKYLKTYYDLFDKESILVILHEDIKSRPRDVLIKLYNFINVDSKFVPTVISKTVNKSSVSPKYIFLNQLIDVRKIFKKYFFGRALVSMFKRLGVNYFIKKIHEWNHRGRPGRNREHLSQDFRMRLIKNFDKDINKLSNLSGVNFYIWKYGRR